MMSGCGLLDGSRTLSYPHLVMETEIYRIGSGSPGASLDDETLALDAIRRVRSGGTYSPPAHPPARPRHLAAGRVGPHAVRRLAGRRAPGGARRAVAIADGILANHHPEPRPADLAAELRAIAARADAALS